MAQVLYTLGVVVALGAAIAAIPRIWHGVRWTYRLLKRIDEISHLGPVVVGMAKQFQRNGGTSLKDAVVSLKDDVAALKGNVEDRLGDQDRMLIGIMGRMGEVYAVKEQVSDLTGRVGNLAKTTGDLTVAVGEMKLTADANAERLAKVENWIAREIQHAAAGDLNESNLRKELEQREREIAEQQAKDADDGPTDNVGQI